jgi:hypothetical protein
MLILRGHVHVLIANIRIGMLPILYHSVVALLLLVLQQRATLRKVIGMPFAVVTPAMLRSWLLLRCAWVSQCG